MIVTEIKILRQQCKTLSKQEYDNLKIFETLQQELSKVRGVGLSAIQLGIPIRASVIRMPKLKVNLYNPEVVALSEPFIFIGEACLSIPGKVGATKRFNKIIVKNGDGKIIKAEGIHAVVLQHEIDHMNGILFIDRLTDKK